MVIEINDFNDSRVALFRNLTDKQLRVSLEAEQGVFIAETPNVIITAVQSGMEPLALLCSGRQLRGTAKPVIEFCGEIPVYTATDSLLEEIAGFHLTKGVLCAMKRPINNTLESVCSGTKRLAVIYGVVDATNIGAIFRSAAALGIDAVVVSGKSCDPLNRRAVRVSMGTVFQVPWTLYEAPVSQLYDELHNLGFNILAMALSENSVSLGDKKIAGLEKSAMVFGSEGYGLPPEAVSLADFVVKIPMQHGVDSLNVAASSAVAFWELCNR